MAIPKFKPYADGKPIPPVDPEDVKRCWHLKPPWVPGHDHQSACSPGADVAAVSERWGMIDTLTNFKLLTPWQHGEELDDAVFRIAATFPLHVVKLETYTIAGDEYFGFDPNAFMQRLIEETGISHVWEPVPTKLAERGRGFTLCSVNYAGQVPDPKREAKRQTRELVWAVWKRFSPSRDQLTADSDIVAILFADFLIENMDLVSQVEAGLRARTGGELDALMELERRAQSWPGLP